MKDPIAARSQCYGLATMTDRERGTWWLYQEYIFDGENLRCIDSAEMTTEDFKYHPDIDSKMNRATFTTLGQGMVNIRTKELHRVEGMQGKEHSYLTEEQLKALAKVDQYQDYEWEGKLCLSKRFI